MRAAAAIYRYVVKPVLFLFPAQTAHNFTFAALSKISSSKILCNIISKITKSNSNTPHRVGLAAGLEYTGSCVNYFSAIGFNYVTVGTLTFQPWAGNAGIQLGRLPKSRSLLVNKGFKNPGIVQVLSQLRPTGRAKIGVSIGQTPCCTTVESAIKDIVAAFEVSCNYQHKFSYYELNISCPNITSDKMFYEPKNLDNLLKCISINKLPLYIKMPISLDNERVLALCEAAKKHKFVTGLVIGNAQTKRDVSLFDPYEINAAGKGSFSGKPTFARSNELIRLVKKRYATRFEIVGTGGVFSAQDARIKRECGADWVQVATGLIFTGPTLPMEIRLVD